MIYSSNGVSLVFSDHPAERGDSGEPILLIHGFASNARINWLNPRWVETLTRAGRRVVAFDNRGHGQSEKLYDPQAYAPPIMAADALGLMRHLGIARFDCMGYSMGARIAAFAALAAPGRVRRLVLAGLGDHLAESEGQGEGTSAGLPPGIADAMEAASLAELTDPTQRLFRSFADKNHSDLKALAACIRGSRQNLSRAELGAIACPTLVCVGTRDTIAGDGARLAAMLPHGRFLAIPDRDHNLAVGDKSFKAGVLAFLEAQAGS